MDQFVFFLGYAPRSADRMERDYLFSIGFNGKNDTILIALISQNQAPFSAEFSAHNGWILGDIS